MLQIQTCSKHWLPIFSIQRYLWWQQFTPQFKHAANIGYLLCAIRRYLWWQQLLNSNLQQTLLRIICHIQIPLMATTYSSSFQAVRRRPSLVLFETFQTAENYIYFHCHWSFECQNLGTSPCETGSFQEAVNCIQNLKRDLHNHMGKHQEAVLADTLRNFASECSINLPHLKMLKGSPCYLILKYQEKNYVSY